MVNFIDSFSKGIIAAKKSEQNKDEIDSVFEILNRQISEASSGKIEIKIIFKSNPFLDFLAVASDVSKVSYWAITASNPLAEDFRPTEIAKWKADQNGYPCQIITDAEEIYCEDKGALENALQTLLASPVVGEKLYTVMNQKPKAKVDSQGS
jgi:hypothetical protein